jgi:TolA-binding protein
MRRLNLIILCSFLWLSCGGVKETVQVGGVSEDDIARSLVRQEGERPVIKPESLPAKIPPPKIVTATKTTETAPALPKTAAAAPTQVKPEVKIPLADTTKLAADTAKVIDTVAVKAPSKIVVSQPQAVVIAPPTKPKPILISSEAEPMKDLLLQNLSFDDIYFNSGEWAMPSSNFNSNYYVTLGKLVKALKADPEIKIRISAYTDNEGDPQSEYQIAQKRALTFGKLLIELFPQDKKLEIAERIEINPVGSSELLVETPNNARRMLNRRVSFELFYGELHNNPYAHYMDTKTVSTTTQKAIPAASTSTSYSKTSAALSIQQKLYDKAMALFNQKRYNEAIDIFDEILQIDKNHPLADNAQFWIGEALYYQGRYQEALKIYQQVFGLGDRNKEAYAQVRLGYCYLRIGNTQQAVAELNKVLQNYSRFPEEVKRAEMVLAKIKSD